jgi:acylphosphatase
MKFRDIPGLASRHLAPARGHLKHWPCFAMVRHYVVKGRVQGVGFRWFVHREAAALDLSGWVRNTEDGHVEVLAAGEAESLAELGLALRRGSRGSRVDAVIVNELDPKEAEGLGPFRIEGAW